MPQQRYTEIGRNAGYAQQIYLILIGCARRNELITYGRLAQMIGFGGVPATFRPLGHIMYWCAQNGLPPLTALVVNRMSGECGGSLRRFRGETVDAGRMRVFRRRWYLYVVPTRREFRTAWLEGIAGAFDEILEPAEG